LVKYHPSLVVRGFGKLLVVLTFASLLVFVVVHSAEVHRVAVAFCEALRVPLFSLAVDPRSVERTLMDAAVPKKPDLSPLFQRPPPASSL
jgi:hypothetical protein